MNDNPSAMNPSAQLHVANLITTAQENDKHLLLLRNTLHENLDLLSQLEKAEAKIKQQRRWLDRQYVFEEAIKDAVKDLNK